MKRFNFNLVLCAAMLMHVAPALSIAQPSLLASLFPRIHAYMNSWRLKLHQKLVKQELAQEFQEKENALMQELFSILGISEKEWEKWVTRFKPVYEKSEANVREDFRQKGKQLSKALQDKASTLLKKHGLSHIHVIPSTDLQMAAGKSFIKINEDKLVHQTETEIELGILHEIQHIKHDDAFHCACISGWFLNHRHEIPDSWIKNYKRAFSHNLELRAELLALTHKETSCWLEYQQRYFGARAANDTHPSTMTVYNEIGKLYQKMTTLA